MTEPYVSARSVPMTLVHGVLWRRLDQPALEHSRTMLSSEGYMIEGRVIMLLGGVPTEAHYVVRCGPDWITRYARVELVQHVATKQIQVRRDGSGRWWVDDRQRPDLDGVLDIDLALSPSTNTLPIRRLALAVGDSRPTDAAWVRFPELTCERLSQRYTRAGELHYRYESDSGAFVTDIQVDEHGVVTRYGDIWERVTG